MSNTPDGIASRCLLHVYDEADISATLDRSYDGKRHVVSLKLGPHTIFVHDMIAREKLIKALQTPAIGDTFRAEEDPK